MGGSTVAVSLTQVGLPDLRGVQARSLKKKGRVLVRHCSLHSGGPAWRGRQRQAGPVLWWHAAQCKAAHCLPAKQVADPGPSPSKRSPTAACMPRRAHWLTETG